MTKTCPSCSAAMEHGFTTAHGLMGGDQAEGRQGQLLFVVPGTPTSPSPLKAFQQGLSDDPAEHRYRIAGFRCPACGLLQLFADGEPSA